jgi:hypothetical protein
MSERDVSVLLKTMRPELRSEPVVFCSLRNVTDVPLPAIASFREAEGLTLVLPKRVAEELELTYAYVAAWITLTVHSDLDAVGFLAAITQPLAAAGISCNVFSAVYHDHLFVPFGRGEDALAVLERLSKEA